ASVHEFLVK
nr:RecName: Full=Venom protein HR-3 [Vespa orientalis]